MRKAVELVNAVSCRYIRAYNRDEASDGVEMGRSTRVLFGGRFSRPME
jgi:hypothetical protein